MKTGWLWDLGKPRTPETPAVPEIREIPVDRIRPNPAQPRLHYEPRALEELAESIRENGLIQPILVQSPDEEGWYELIAGHRRWLAVQKLGLPVIRAIVEDRDSGDSAVLALVDACLEPPHDSGTRIVLLRDYRLFVNTLNRAVDTMAQAGIRVESESHEEGEYLEYRIRIPKVQAYRQKNPAPAGR